jgi:sporulation protein YlmC with PRC-barrel domain
MRAVAHHGTPDTAAFTIGAEATCTDGPCGTVIRVVVDPLTRTLTHLVVEPKHRKGLGRLVPLDLVEPGSGEVVLHCDLAAFDKLDLAEETEFLPGFGQSGYDPGEVYAWPYFSAGGVGMGVGGGIGTGFGVGNAPQVVTYDTVPEGEIEVRRGERVHATDGEIGRVHGLVVDSSSHHVTHVLLAEGHLWGRKEVAIPIGAVSDVEDGVRLTISKQDVRDLPPVELDEPPTGLDEAGG